MRHCFMTLPVTFILFLAGCASAPATPSSADTVQVMVIATYHMDPQGADVVNIEAADVRTPLRQSELNQLAHALAAFRPTAVAVEREGEPTGYIDPFFSSFTCDALLESKNERTQIAYRLARGLGLERVYAIDEQPADGEPDYFPIGSVTTAAEELDRSDELNGMFGELQSKAKAFANRQGTTSVPELLLDLTLGELVAPDLYYDLTAFDHGESQPASELHAFWFMRNAKIFSKLYQIARPGDRIVVVYGAGHKFWLEHFVGRTSGFELIDSAPYLRAATGSSTSSDFCTGNE